MEWLGFLAGLCTTVSLIPQVVKVVQTRQTRDISLGMYFLMTVGVLFWFLYGLSMRSVSIIAANSVTFVLSMVVLVYKLLEKKDHP